MTEYAIEHDAYVFMHCVYDAMTEVIREQFDAWLKEQKKEIRDIASWTVTCYPVLHHLMQFNVGIHFAGNEEDVACFCCKYNPYEEV